MQSFIMNSYEIFIHIHQGCFAGTGAIVRLPQYQWSKPDVYGKTSQCITTTKHSKAKTVCIFLRIYCTMPLMVIHVRYCRITFFNLSLACPNKTSLHFNFSINRLEIKFLPLQRVSYQCTAPVKFEWIHALVKAFIEFSPRPLFGILQYLYIPSSL